MCRDDYLLSPFCSWSLATTAWPCGRARFMYGDSRPLTRQQLTSTVQSIIHSVGYSRSYSGHSFQICASTTAASCGVPEHLIKTFGRCSSDAYQVYVLKPICSIIHVSNQRYRRYRNSRCLLSSQFGASGVAQCHKPQFLVRVVLNPMIISTWRAELVAELWVRRAIGVFYHLRVMICGLWHNPQTIGHLTSTCDIDVKGI